MKVNKEKRYGERRGFLRTEVEEEEEEIGGFIISACKLKTRILVPLLCGL